MNQFNSVFRRSRLGLVLLFALVRVALFGQEMPPAPAAAFDSAAPQKFPHSYTIGLTVIGTNALPGLDVAAQIAPRFAARLGYGFFNHSIHLKNYALKKGAQQLYNVDVDFRLSNISLLADWLMTKSGRVRLTLGAGYFIDNQINSYLETANNSAVYDIELEPQEVGNMTTTMEYTRKIAPYVGVGFWRVIPKKRWSFALDLGTFYKGKPDVEIVGTGLLTENDRNEAPLERNLSKTFWPVLAARIAYKL